MSVNNDVEHLVLRLEDALRENRRFRERIELLASQNHHLRERLRETLGPPPEAVAFEVLGVSHRPGEVAGPEPRCEGQPEGIHRLLKPWFPVFEEGIQPLDPSPGLRCLTAFRASIRMGFLLFGLDTDGTEEAVSKVEERQLRDRDFIPVFITDGRNFSAFRSRGYVFEHIPTSIARAHQSQDSRWRTLQDRLELIKAKWGLRDIVDLSGSDDRLK